MIVIIKTRRGRNEMGKKKERRRRKRRRGGRKNEYNHRLDFMLMYYKNRNIYLDSKFCKILNAIKFILLCNALKYSVS